MEVEKIMMTKKSQKIGLILGPVVAIIFYLPSHTDRADTGSNSYSWNDSVDGNLVGYYSGSTVGHFTSPDRWRRTDEYRRY